MEALALFFMFCIMCMMFVIMGVLLWFAYKLYKGMRTVKKYTKPRDLDPTKGCVMLDRIEAVLKTHRKWKYRTVPNRFGSSSRPECTCGAWPWSEAHVARRVLDVIEKESNA